MQNEGAIYKRKWKNRRKVRGEGLQQSGGRISITKFVFRLSSQGYELPGKRRGKDSAAQIL